MNTTKIINGIEFLVYQTDKLILDILPDVLNKQQKENKVRNLIYSMHKNDKTIVNKGTSRKPIWKKFV